MDGSQPQESSRVHRLHLDLNHDYISNLPADLKDKILVKLPIKEAVRTSILSSKWKNSWASIPNLVFEEKSTESGLVKLVDMVLLVHHGPIVKFKLVSEHACNEAIGRWLLVLSRNEIKDLELRFNGDEECEIPSYFFSCLTLERVLISGSAMHVPRFFLGFKFLRTLELSQFNLTGNTIGQFISSCPLLESLELSDFVEHGCLVIRAPNLRWLRISGEFVDLCLETPKLLFASIQLDSESLDLSSSAYKDCKSNLRRALGGLHAIEELELLTEFIAYLAMGPIPGMLPVPFHQLKELHIDLCSMEKDEVAAAFCLFRSAPNLKVLSLNLFDGGTSLPQTLWEVKGTEYNLFKCLEIVNIPIFGTPESILEVAKFLLRTAPVLEKLALREKDVNRLKAGMGFLEKVESFPRLSKKAIIGFVEEPDEEEPDEEPDVDIIG